MAILIEEIGRLEAQLDSAHAENKRLRITVRSLLRAETPKKSFQYEQIGETSAFDVELQSAVKMMKKKVAASPDFYGLDEAAAMADLKARIELYEQQYQSCSEADGAYIKLSDLSTQVVAHRIYGRMASEVLPFLLSLHFVPRPIYLVSAPPDGADGSDAAARDRAHCGRAAWRTATRCPRPRPSRCRRRACRPATRPSSRRSCSSPHGMQ